MDTLSTNRRQTRDRIKMMIVYHFTNVSTEIRFTDWCRTNRVSPTNFSEAMAELISEKEATRAGFYMIAGPKGYESFQIFAAVTPVAVEEVEENINIRFVETAGRYGVAA